MRKLIRNGGAAGAATMVVAGVLLATGGSAAAAPRPTGHGAAGTAAVHAGPRTPCRRAPGQRIDPWVAGQLAWFDPAARHRLAVYDPWVKDQLARFASPSC